MHASRRSRVASSSPLLFTRATGGDRNQWKRRGGSAWPSHHGRFLCRPSDWRRHDSAESPALELRRTTAVAARLGRGGPLCGKRGVNLYEGNPIDDPLPGPARFRFADRTPPSATSPITARMPRPCGGQLVSFTAPRRRLVAPRRSGTPGVFRKCSRKGRRDRNSITALEQSQCQCHDPLHGQDVQ